MIMSFRTSCKIAIKGAAMLGAQDQGDNIKKRTWTETVNKDMVVVNLKEDVLPDEKSLIKTLLQLV